MASAAYVQRGEALDYTNTTDAVIASGTVLVTGTRLGVTGCEIAPGQTGSLHVTGVYRIPKTDPAAITMGQAVYYDGTGITGTASGDTTVPAGYAAAPAAASDADVLVNLNR